MLSLRMKKRVVWSLAIGAIGLIVFTSNQSSNTTSALAVPSGPPSSYTSKCEQCRADLIHIFTTYANIGSRLGDTKAVSAANRGKAAASKMSNDDFQDYVVAHQEVAR